MQLFAGHQDPEQSQSSSSTLAVCHLLTVTTVINQRHSKKPASCNFPLDCSQKSARLARLTCHHRPFSPKDAKFNPKLARSPSPS